MPASTAPRLLDGAAAGALARARSLELEELLAIVERSGLRGRGGAGFPLVEKLRTVRRNAAGGEAYVVANGYDADPGSPLARTLLGRSAANVIVDAPRGTGGFGYDPHFEDLATGMTGAELPLARKNELSHRGKAMRALIDKLRNEQ